ncbi:antitoxin VbhA family protein [Paralysiella testudinis]|uniref:Antitoxin VbhA family protein n=1 Tax=Paralysiella testudinis TaxID=2809020 RepID=A0A892ZGG3_9NEIS|nr:antitoxin VbhA family protein [Paralysiella testudinis]QRQ82585.1 antitoxin VbhA family protein [Paralysiella testudinis]
MKTIDKAALLVEFERPKVVNFTAEEIARRKKSFIQIVASCALENAEPDEFGKVVVMERIRGELTHEQADMILREQCPDETARIQAKIRRMHQLGLSWIDL